MKTNYFSFLRFILVALSLAALWKSSTSSWDVTLRYSFYHHLQTLTNGLLSSKKLLYYLSEIGSVTAKQHILSNFFIRFPFEVTVYYEKKKVPPGGDKLCRGEHAVSVTQTFLCGGKCWAGTVTTSSLNMLPSALTRHPDMKEKLIYKKTHPNICTKTHTHACIHTVKENMAFISQNEVSLQSWGFKKEEKKRRNCTRCLITGKNASTHSSWHDHKANLTQIWSKELKYRKTSREWVSERGLNGKKNCHNSLLGETATTEFYKKLHPVLHLRGLRNLVEILPLAWQLSRSPRLRFITLKQILSDILQRSVMLHLHNIYSL